LLPLIVLASVVSLVLGYFLMLPDDLENFSQAVVTGNMMSENILIIAEHVHRPAVVTGNMMSENILSAITIKNYWTISKDYKPLMHLWYVGVLFEFYIVMP